MLGVVTAAVARGGFVVDFVGRSKCGMGAVAVENLVGAGFEAWYPKIRNDSGEFEYLFPRYFFVSCSGSRRDIVKINHTRGVQRLLPQHLEDPLRLPEGYLPRLLLMIEKQETIEVVQEEMVAFARGQSVVVKCGPHAGIVGTFEKRKKGLLEITIACLGRQHVVSVPLQNVSVNSANNDNTRIHRRTVAPQYRRRRAA